MKYFSEGVRRMAASQLPPLAPPAMEKQEGGGEVHHHREGRGPGFIGGQGPDHRPALGSHGSMALNNGQSMADSGHQAGSKTRGVGPGFEVILCLMRSQQALGPVIPMLSIRDSI